MERLFITNRDLLYKKSYITSLKQDFETVINSFVTIKNYENEPTLDSPPIIIFHCEYSQERGPRMLSHLRKIDRDVNRYPQLTYPEIYLLAEGYRNFYSQSPVKPSFILYPLTNFPYEFKGMLLSQGIH